MVSLTGGEQKNGPELPARSWGIWEINETPEVRVGRVDLVMLIMAIPRTFAPRLTFGSTQIAAIGLDFPTERWNILLLQ